MALAVYGLGAEQALVANGGAEPARATNGNGVVVATTSPDAAKTAAQKILEEIRVGRTTLIAATPQFTANGKAPAPETKPFYKKPLFWGLVAGGAAVLGLGWWAIEG